MAVNFSIKQRKGDTWFHVSLADVAGKTLRELFLSFIGKEVVAEFIIDQERFFFCGTAFWLERMLRKGKAITFLKAVDVVQERCPYLLEEKIPAAELIANIFSEPGTQMEACSFENPSSKFEM